MVSAQTATAHNLTATVVRNTVSLAWQAPSSPTQPVTGYQIDVGLTPSGLATSLPLGNTTVFSTEAPDGTFFLRIQALSAAGPTGPSNEVRVDVGQAAAPLPPLNLVGTTGGGQVSIQWTENPAGPSIAGYLLEAGTAAGLTNVGVVPLSALTRSLAAPVPSGTYHVRIRAANRSGQSAPSNEITLLVEAGSCVPGPPRTLTATTGPGSVSLAWAAPETGGLPTGYRLDVGSTSGTSNLVSAPLSLSRSFSSPAPAGRYFIRVLAIGPCGASAPSNEVVVDVSTGSVTFPGVSDFAAAGPFAVTVENNTGPSGVFTIFRPASLGQNGLRHPILAWGNGTATTPATYAALLGHLASHGFVVIAANTTNAGSGVAMRQGIDWLVAQDGAPGGVFSNRLDIGNIGAFGHSQGGGGAINAGAHPRVRTVIPIQPLPQPQFLQGTMLLLCGGNDTIVHPETACRNLVYTPAIVPTFFGILNGVDHFAPFGDGGPMRAPITAWFRGELMRDQSARARFYGSDCTYCVNPGWQVSRKGF